MEKHNTENMIIGSSEQNRNPRVIPTNGNITHG